MGQLSFLKTNAVEGKIVKYVVSDRYLDENGKPEVWQIKGIDSEENEKLRESCTDRIPVPGRRGQFTPELNVYKYLCKLAVASTVYPNLHDAVTQDSFGAMGAENLLRKMLISGEYDEYINEVQRVNKYDVTLQDKVDAAKN
jgi:Phage XkdN-like protein.